MIGLLSLILGGLFGIGDVIKDRSWDAKSRKEYDRTTGAWMDRQGRWRDVNTSNILQIFRDNNFDLIRKDIQTGITRNLSEENREQQFAEIQQRNDLACTVVLWNGRDEHIDLKDNSALSPRLQEGKWYRDIKTGRFYAIRIYSGIRFYIDVETGNLIRKTDEQLTEDDDNTASLNKNPSRYLSDFPHHYIDLKLPAYKKNGILRRRDWYLTDDNETNELINEFNVKTESEKRSSSFVYHSFELQKLKNGEAIRLKHL